MNSGGTFTLRRRYEAVDYRKQEGGYAIMLDENQLMTPGGMAAVATSEALAIAITAEWQKQGDAIKPESMPLTQLLMTAQDRIAPQRAAVIKELLRYLDTELICHYGIDESLVAYQRKHWQPLHTWLTSTFTVMLPVTFGIQPTRSVLPLDIFRAHLERMDPCHLSALSLAVAASGSFVIGLALVAGQIDAPTALLAAEAERDWQAQKWGEDADNAASRAGVLADLNAAATFVSLLQ